MNRCFILNRSLLLTVLLASLCSAQQPAPSPEPSPAQQKPEQPAGNAPAPADAPSQQPSTTEQEKEKEKLKQEQSQRILGVVPQFGVTSRQDAAPLTPGQKFHLFAKSTFDPFQFAAAGLQAGIGQATNEFPGYGQGAAGYGKRYGASFADATSSGFFSNFAYPVLLREDPRYFRLGEGSVKHRILYSLSQEFVTHTDKGTRRFNFSNVLGAFSAGGLSNVYYPQSDRGFGLTMSRSAISLAYGSAGGLIDEFWADIDKKLLHHKPKQTRQSTQATTPPDKDHP